MCKTGPHFKLCSCSAEKLGENYWRLTRGNSVENIEVVGQWLPPLTDGQDYFFDTESFVIDRLLFDINNSPVFDFEYAPEEDDLLEIFMGEVLPDDIIGLALVYSDGQFEFSETEKFFRDDGKRLAIGNVRYVPKP
jgi:hypothetical protein